MSVRIAKNQWVLTSAIFFAMAIPFAMLGGTSHERVASEERELPGGVLDAEMYDLPWLIGEWQHVAGGDESRFSIERNDVGIYSVHSDQSHLAGSTLYLIRSGCERLAIVEFSERGGDMVMFARVSGYSERLSLDLIPAVFPQAWTDPFLHEQFDYEGGGELPKEHRLAALALFADSIDAKGTFMEQDLTFYRPFSLKEMRSMLQDSLRSED